MPNANTFILAFNTDVKLVEPFSGSYNVNTFPLVGPGTVLNSIFSVLVEPAIGPLSSASTGAGALGIPPTVPIIIGCC